MTAFQRIIAIGDIHGYRNKLQDLLAKMRPTSTDLVVFIDGYIDRGPDSRGMNNRLLEFGQRYPQTVFLCGNHKNNLLEKIDNELRKITTCS